MIEKGEYKSSPLVVIKKDEADRFPFSFGKGKAAKLLKALLSEPKALVDLMVEVAEDEISDEERQNLQTFLTNANK
jgi:hypothetical protein